jgi:hypothetical protein
VTFRWSCHYSYLDSVDEEAGKAEHVPMTAVGLLVAGSVTAGLCVVLVEVTLDKIGLYGPKGSYSLG